MSISIEKLTKRFVPILLVVMVCPKYVSAADSQVSAKPCPIKKTSDWFPFRSRTLYSGNDPSNQGIVPPGFVELSDGTASVHGIDVSKWQDSANFRRAADCGAKFSYVRLSAGIFPDSELEYRVHWANSRAVKLLTGGYHYLTVSALRNSLPQADSADASKLMTETKTSARAQALLYLSRLIEVLRLDSPSKESDKNTKQIGSRVLPIVLSAGSVATKQNKLTAENLQEYGKYYTAAICEWISTVRQQPLFKNAPIILFTFPYIYRDYRFDQATCGLSELPLWISYSNSSGSRLPETEDDLSLLLHEICERKGTNRCIMQLYTSYGSFLDFHGKLAIDLNRYYGTLQELQATQFTVRF